MASQSWVSLVNAGTPGPGTAVNSATTATISPCQAGALTADVAVVNAAGQPLGWYPGMMLRVTANGLLTTVSTIGTVTFFLTANKANNNSYTTLATAAGITTTSTVLTGIMWRLEAVVQCTAVASSGNTVSTQGVFTMGNIGNALPSNPTSLSANPPPGFYLPLPNSAGPTTAAVDTTQLTGIGLRVTQATSTCTIQCTQWLVEALD